MTFQKYVSDSLYLFNQSEDHRLYTLVDFTHFALFPILHNRVRFYYSDDKPIGMATWAWFSDKEAEDFLSERWIPQEDTYKREIGDQLWAIEFIFPFSPQHTLIRHVMRDATRAATNHLNEKHKVNWRRLKRPDQRHIRRI